MSETPAFPPMTDAEDLGDLLRRSQARLAEERAARSALAVKLGSEQMAVISHGISRNWDRLSAAHSQEQAAWSEKMSEVWARLAALSGDQWHEAAADYVTDFAQRSALMLDAFRERGDTFLAHEAAGCPPVLVYGYDVVMDGRELKRPCNYRLLHIKAPAGTTTIDQKRPYVIIDPRAGHGAGIGGFKSDSQVGVAMKAGHPVYFVAFTPDPVETQTLADVTRAEAEFVREVMRRHPESNKPIIIGNCQGGWATALLAAMNPDITGPIVLNGAPMAYWAGEVGHNPMRYNGGLMGGVLPAMVISDMLGGKFDGAWLVWNFEFLNPSRNFFSQYYDLFRTIDEGKQRFLDFQKWWGGYFWMTEAEIRWIVEQLFVGNRLARGKAEIEPGRFVNVKSIKAPIIVFASHGDNITPPQQALNWIPEAYASEDEIKLAGQRIIYMIHEKVGHLGIFVSSSVAKREHTEMASTMKTIESLPPGLYEMKIEDVIGEGHDAHFTVSFHKRRLADIEALDDGIKDEQGHAAVARASELAAELYEIGGRPMMRAMSSPAMTEFLKMSHPMRTQRWLFASSNPLMGQVPEMAEKARRERRKAAKDNPFVAMERLWAESFAQMLDFGRDLRDMSYEAMFYGLWSHPAAIRFGGPRGVARMKKTAAELRLLPEVQAALMRVEDGEFEEAVIRMLIMLADARGSVRRDRLERSAKVLSQDAPFKELGQPRRVQMIQEQSVIAQFEPEAALDALPKMLRSAEDRSEAMAVVEFIIGPVEEMEPHSLQKLQQFRRALDLAPIEVPEASRVHSMEAAAASDGAAGNGAAAGA